MAQLELTVAAQRSRAAGGRLLEAAAPGNRATLGYGRSQLIGQVLGALCCMYLLFSTHAAEQKTFTLLGQAIPLEDISDETDVYFTAMRFNRVLNVWNVEVVATNHGRQVFSGPFALVFDGFTNVTGLANADGEVEGKAFAELTRQVLDGALSPAEVTLPHTLAFSASGGGAPAVAVRLFGRRPSGIGVAVVRTLDGAGLPLPGVSITETGPGGTRLLATDARFGLATLGQRVGNHLWKFEKARHLPVWRSGSITSNEVLRVPHPRLPARSVNSHGVTATQGGQGTNSTGRISIAFPAGAVAQPVAITLTELTGQNLPAPLPLGWSPLQGFWLESTGSLLQPGEATLSLWDEVGAGEVVTLARWDTNATRWMVLRNVAGPIETVLSSTIPGAGAYVVAVPDTGVSAPPPAVIGEELQGANAGAPGSSGLFASGQVEPPVSAASTVPELVTAMGRVWVTNVGGTLPSGTLLNCEVTESYTMRDGTRRVTPVYDTFIAGYQRPGRAGAGILTADFPLRPLLLYGADELEEARVAVDVLSPAAYSGSFLGTNGGLVAGGGVQVLAKQGDFEKTQGVVLRVFDAARFAGVSVGSNELVKVFQLDVPETVQQRPLSIGVDLASTNSHFVLARVLAEAGGYGLEPVERFATGPDGRFATVEPANGQRLPGVTGAGQYLLLRVPGPQALVSGAARDAKGQPLTGATVRSGPWLTRTGPNGVYRVVAPAGSVEMAITDPVTGDTGSTTATVTDPAAVLGIDLSAAPTGPQVISVSPTNNAVAVSRVAAITVGFSEPVNPATLLAGNLQLVSTNGVPVAVSLTLNLQNTAATLLPTDPLPANSRFTIQLSTNVTDLNGLPLEGARTFTFTTESDPLTRLAAEVVMHEPTNGLARVTGGSGMAEPGREVILVNESSGATVTVLAGPDGSFDSFIEADVEDELSAVVVNANGTRTTSSASRQIFRDGSVGLYRGGGILEAESDAGPLRVTVEPGAIANRTKFKIEQVSVTEILTLLSNTPPTNSTLIGRGIKIRAEGDPVTGDLDISIPVTEAELARAGITNSSEAARAVLGLVSPFTLAGDPVYVLVDKMEYENGRLVTHSPPFPGAGRLLNPTSAQREAFDAMLMLNTFGHLGGGAEAAAVNLAVMPVLMHPRAQPALLAGKVFEAVADDNNQVAALRTLAGALVTANSLGQFSQGRPGRLPPGSICCVSGETGGYALMVPVPELGGAFGSPEDFVLTASHPRRPDIKRVLASAQQANARLTDIIFPAFARGPANDPFPPKVTVFHTPDFPAPEAEAEIVVLASHGSGQPAVELVKDDPNIPDDAVEIALDQREVVGPTAVRSTFKVVSHTNAVIRFRASATVGSAPRTDVPYAVAFAGTPPVVANPPASDPNDKIGPWVLRSSPRNDLSQSAPALATGEPIVIEFNEPISQSVLQNAAVSLQPSAGILLKELSTDQRVLTIRAYALRPGQQYTLTINQQVTDISTSQNKLDQIPLTPEKDPFILRFRTAPILTGELSGIEQGGGVVLRGNRAFALERTGPLNGAVVVYDLSDPQNPNRIGQLSVPGFPRDLALIPGYAFKTQLAGSATTNDLLAVVGGKLGSGADQQGNLLEGFQYLWIINIENPASPVRLASAVLTPSPSAAVTRIQWSPPLLAYLQSDADSQAIGLLNLQSFILGSTISRNEFSPTNDPGRDLNGDGDYVDPGELLPVPSVSQTRIAGESGRFGLENSTQRIQDFDFVTAEGYLGVALGPGEKLDQTGQPAGTLPAGYMTLLKRFVRPNPDDAFLELTGGLPKRVTTLFGLRFVDATGQPKVADLALVSVGSELQVVEITDPTEPRLLQSIRIPSAHGLAQSVKIRDDGMLLLATTDDLLLLDPGKLGLPQPSGDQPHPALRGVIPGAGSGARSFDGEAAGLHVVNLGGRHLVKQTAPQLFFVSFTEPPFAGQSTAPHPDDFRADPAKVESALGRIQRATALPPARFRPQQEQNQTIPSELSPPSLSAHFYVLVQAPGAAGDTIELALESLNESGYPLRNKGSGFAPVRAMSDAALDKIKQRPRFVEPVIRSLTAYRLSSVTNDPAFNMYLSKPFALVCEPMKIGEVQALRNELEREVIWSGHYLRAYIDYSMSPTVDDNKLVGPFAGVPDQVQPVILPGAVVVAESFPADSVQGPNPVAAIGHATVPGTFGCLCLHNGEMRGETIDFNLPSRRMPIIFKRVIAGQDLYEGPFGRGWDFNYNQRMVLLRPSVTPQKCPCSNARVNASPLAGDLLFFNGEGRVLVYSNAGPAAPPEFAADPLAIELGWTPGKVATFFRSPTGVFDMVVQFTDQRFGRLLPDGTQFWYSPVGRLETIYHRYTKNFQTLHYNERGELIRIQDRSVDIDRYLDIGYYRSPTEQSVISPVDKVTQNPAEIGKIYRLVDYTGGAAGVGRDVLFHYNDRGELKQRQGIEVLTTSHPSGFLGRQITEYEYGQGPPDGPPQFPLANDFTGIVGGDPGGAPLARVSAYAGTGETPVVASMTGAQGTVGVEIQYPNTPGALASGTGKVQVTSPDSSQTQITLSEFGFPKLSKFSGNSGPPVPPVEYETLYNAFGLPRELRYPKGDRVVYTYESVSFNLRNRPNVRMVQRFPWPGGGGGTLTGTRQYDLKYNFQSGAQVDFDGKSIIYETTPDGLDIGRVIYPSVTPAFPTNYLPPFTVGLGAIESFQYNVYGQVIRHQDANGVVRQWRFDRPDGFATFESQGEGAEELRTVLEYGGNLAEKVGLPHRRKPPLHEPTKVEFDELERLIATERQDQVSTFAYDESGRLKRRSSLVQPGKELVEERFYEQTGFLKEKRVLSIETGINPQLEKLTTRYTPDALFRVAQTIYPNGEIESLEEFDHLGRPHRRRLGDYTETYSYDDNNNLLSITRGNFRTEFQYDGHNRLVKELQPTAGGGPPEEVNLSYFDGGAIRETVIKNRDSRVVAHVKYQVDGLGRRIVTETDADAGPAIQLQRFDPVPRARHSATAVGDISFVSYDTAGRPLLTTNSLRSTQYTSDQNNNLLLTVSVEGTSGRNVYTNDYRPYDELDRSRKFGDNEGLISSSSYREDDLVSEFIDGRGGTNNYSYTRLGEPLVIRRPGGIEFHYAYDRNRNKTFEGDIQDMGFGFSYDSTLRVETQSRRDGHSLTNSNFDALNLPRTVISPGLDATLAYDPQGRLLSYNCSYLGYLRRETNSYDGLDRIETATFNGGSVSNRYDLLGPLREVRLQVGAHNYSLKYDIRLDGIRTNLVYSSSAISGGPVAEQRDVAGRLRALLPASADPVVSETVYDGADLIGRQTFGLNLFACDNFFDGRKRLVHRKYTRPDGKTLAELRYAFDANNNLVARQSLHRGGRTDFFKYDAYDRLVRADMGARPAVANAALRPLPGFAVPAEARPANASWSAGFFARTYAYDGQMLDLLTSATTINPDSFQVPRFAALIGSFDSALHANRVDSFSRSRDPMGNTTNTVLHVRVPGSPAPVAVSAALRYDAKGQLVRLQRADGVAIEYEYLPSGLCYSRKVSGPANLCVPSERIFVWDGPRLLEEYDVTPLTRTLRARYFYTDSDVPVAADMADTAGTLRRIYFLIDIQGSLLATVDPAGQILDRYAYDAWGQPEIELADAQAPVVRRILSAPDGLLIEFSERIQPPVIQAPGPSKGEFAVSLADLAAGLTIEQSGARVPGTFVYEESRAGFALGTLVRFQPASALSGNYTLRVQAGAVNDEWNNPIASESLSFAFNSTPGSQLFANLVSTASALSGRTVFDQPFLFHGQYFDFEAGLVYLRARFYDPFMGSFLQPDPAGYADSVNPYAGFGNNPQSFRDPSGNLVFVPVLAAVGAVIGGVIAGGLEYMDQAEQVERGELKSVSVGNVLYAAAGGAVGGAFAGFTAGGSLLIEGAVLGAVGGLAGGSVELRLRGEQYTPEAALRNGVTGAAGGVVGAVAGRLVGRALGETIEHLRARNLPGGVIESSTVRGRVAPVSRQVPDAVQTGLVPPSPGLPAARPAPAEAIERTEVIHRDALVLEQASVRLRKATMDFFREARGFIEVKRVDDLKYNGRAVEGLATPAQVVQHQHMERPLIQFSLAKGRMEGGDTFAHELFHARQELGEITNPFGAYSKTNPQAVIWEEAMAFKHGFAWQLQTRRAGEALTNDLQNYMRGGDDWLVRELAGRYGVQVSDALSVLGHLTP